MTIDQVTELASRWVNGECPICRKELKDVARVHANLPGLTVEICASHPTPENKNK